MENIKFIVFTFAVGFIFSNMLSLAIFSLHTYLKKTNTKTDDNLMFSVALIKDLTGKIERVRNNSCWRIIIEEKIEVEIGLGLYSLIYTENEVLSLEILKMRLKYINKNIDLKEIPIIVSNELKPNQYAIIINGRRRYLSNNFTEPCTVNEMIISLEKAIDDFIFKYYSKQRFRLE